MDSFSFPTPEDRQDSLWRLEKIILDTLDFNEVIQKTVDGVLSELGYFKLGYRIVVLGLVDKKAKILRRVSVTRTHEAKRALEIFKSPITQIDIPLTAENNLCIQVLKTQKPGLTKSWVDILTPPFSEEEAKSAQEDVGIRTSMVYPLISRNEALGIMIFSMVKDEDEISEKEKELIARYTDVVSLSVQNAHLYSSLEATTVKLKRANDRLRELDQIKDEFVSIASHELRTPMTAIKSYVWMVLNTPMQPLNEKVRLYLSRAYDSTERLIRMVQDMLTISRIEGKRLELHKERVDLYELVRQVYEEYAIKASERKMKFILSDKPGTGVVEGDRDKLREVITNIVGNALKFTPSGGSISLDVINTQEDVRVSVSDTGPGILDSDKDKIFQKFSRIAHSYTKMAETAGGTGLGLYIAKQIIALHNGKIWLDSTLGKGTTFYFSLPVYH